MKTTTKLSLLAGASISCLSAMNSQASDLNAKDFYSAPDGTQLDVLYMPNVWADKYKTADADLDAHLSADVLVWRHVLFTDICGTMCTPQFVIPLTRTNIELPGSESESTVGIGDPQIGGTLFTINNPSDREYSGLLSMLTLPVGSYEADRADASAGANRWEATFVYNYTRGLGDKWNVEASLEAQIYGKNDDYYGAELEQENLYRLQAFVTYDLTPTSYVAASWYEAVGGEMKIGGSTIDDTEVTYTMLGMEYGTWLNQQNSVMFSYQTTVAAENTF
ncbi:MAG: protein QbdB, partial [Oleibacter sp.]|nr:protein QbdB [Thalassolituus sp.]